MEFRWLESEGESPSSRMMKEFGPILRKARFANDFGDSAEVEGRIFMD